MADLRDAEGDSQMGDAASASSTSEDAMFPSANTNIQKHNTLAFGGQLSSPPGSQAQASQNDGAMDYLDDGNLGFGKSAGDKFVPGESWKTKKAQDDYQRAWNMLEDKEFSLKQFGDPFEDSLPPHQAKK